MALERIPCCSTLIRIRKPGINNDGEPLGLENVEKEKWAAEVWPPFKSYNENCYYCTKYMTRTPMEDDLYQKRLANEATEEEIYRLLRLLVQSFGEDIEVPLGEGEIEGVKEELEDFIDRVDKTHAALLLQERPHAHRPALPVHLQPRHRLQHFPGRALPATQPRLLPSHLEHQPPRCVLYDSAASTTSRLETTKSSWSTTSTGPAARHVSSSPTATSISAILSFHRTHT